SFWYLADFDEQVASRIRSYLQGGGVFSNAPITNKRKNRTRHSSLTPTIAAAVLNWHAFCTNLVRKKPEARLLDWGVTPVFVNKLYCAPGHQSAWT
uniref:Uncharacterized protein n=1 Tax=Romanomermis culicivorax TaxID=13658 RepID=A0A915HSE4_ROMCU